MTRQPCEILCHKKVVFMLFLVFEKEQKYPEPEGAEDNVINYSPQSGRSINKVIY